MSSSWRNPYAPNAAKTTKEGLEAAKSAKEALAAENRAKVQRRRTEAAFLKGIEEHYELEHMETVKAQVAEDAETRKAAPQPKRPPRVSILPTPVAAQHFRVLHSHPTAAAVVEVAQGGATVWCADADGNVTVGCGGELQPLVSVDASSPVTAMFSTGTHMWIGHSDGTVRCYDAVVFTHITEGQFHGGPVTCFCETPDERVFSGSEDGTLVKWDSEAKNFEAMAKIVPGTTPITALTHHAASGFLLAAGRDGSIRCVNVESGAVDGECAAPGGGAVSSLAVLDGHVFAGGADAELKVFGPDLSQVAAQKTRSPILALAAEPTSKRVWSGEEDGSINVWYATAENGFARERTVVQHSSPVLSLKVLCAVDALKIWSLASSGTNKVWYSSYNRVREQMEHTINALKAVIAQDSLELDRWREIIAQLQHIDSRRKLQLARLLELSNADARRRQFMWTWRKWILAANARRRKLAVASRLAIDTTESLARRYFSKYFRWYRAHQKLRMKITYSKLLLGQSEGNFVQFYFSKMQTFTRLIKQAKKRRDLALILGQQSVRSNARSKFRQWLKWTMKRRTDDRKKAYVAAVMRATTQSLVRAYWIKWRAFHDKRALRERRVEIATMLVNLNAMSRRRHAYHKWRLFMQKRRTHKRQQDLAATLIATSQRGLLAVAYKRWSELRRMKIRRECEARQKQAEADLAAVQGKYRALQTVIEEKQALEALQKELEDEKAALAAREVRLESLRATKNDLLDRMAAEDAKNREKAQSLREQFETLIAQLKAKVLNFHQDYTLITQIKDKGRTVPLSKVFLEAHQQVKRVVVEVTKKPHLPVDEEWPMTPALLGKIPSHQMTALLSAIKTMIVTFDMMDRQTRESMNTDQEIVVNAKWLMKMAELSNEHRRKTLGRGAARVR